MLLYLFKLNANGNYQEARKLLEQQGYGEPVIKEIKPQLPLPTQRKKVMK